ncbi:unnamed protein product, partial [Mesorhabditis spiculigera]
MFGRRGPLGFLLLFFLVLGEVVAQLEDDHRHRFAIKKRNFLRTEKNEKAVSPADVDPYDDDGWLHLAPRDGIGATVPRSSDDGKPSIVESDFGDDDDDHDHDHHEDIVPGSAAEPVRLFPDESPETETIKENAEGSKEDTVAPSAVPTSPPSKPATNGLMWVLIIDGIIITLVAAGVAFLVWYHRRVQRRDSTLDSLPPGIFPDGYIPESATLPDGMVPANTPLPG